MSWCEWGHAWAVTDSVVAQMLHGIGLGGVGSTGWGSATMMDPGVQIDAHEPLVRCAPPGTSTERNSQAGVSPKQPLTRMAGVR